MNELISCLANFAAITTALVAVIGYCRYQLDVREKRNKLETYLKSEKKNGKDKGQRTVLHLMAKLGLTEAEILQASFHSKNIIRRIAEDPETKRAEALLFEWGDEKAGGS